MIPQVRSRTRLSLALAGSQRPALTSRSKWTSPGEQHADRVVGHLLDTIIGHVRDPDTVPGGVLDGYVVEPDAETRDDPQRRSGRNRRGAHRRPIGHDGGGPMLGRKGGDHFRGGGLGGTGNEPEARALDEGRLDRDIGPRIVGEEDGGTGAHAA